MLYYYTLMYPIFRVIPVILKTTTNGSYYCLIYPRQWLIKVWHNKFTIYIFYFIILYLKNETWTDRSIAHFRFVFNHIRDGIFVYEIPISIVSSSHILYLRTRNDNSCRDCGETEQMIGEVGECYKSPVVRRCLDILALEVGVLHHDSAVRFVVRNHEL